MKRRIDIKKIIGGMFSTIDYYPVSVIFSFLLLVTVWVRIELSWESNYQYDVILSALQLSLLVILLVSFPLSRRFRLQNKGYVIVFPAIITSILYFLIINYGVYEGGSKDVISNLTTARTGVIAFVSLLSFIYLTHKEGIFSSFSEAFFFFNRTVLLSFFYFIVIALGSTAVAAALEALVFNNLTEKIYMYLVSTSAWSSFLMFLSNYKIVKNTGVFNQSLSQSRISTILFVKVLIPIHIAYSLVLVLWILRILLTGVWPSFIEQSSIATIFIGCSLWLHIILGNYKQDFISRYRRFICYMNLFVLIVQLIAIFKQVSIEGVMTIEYNFILLWIVATISFASLLRRYIDYKLTIYSLCLIAVISVAPYIGHQTLPPMYQDMKLRHTLEENGMLVDNVVMPSDLVVGKEEQDYIYKAVTYLIRQQEYALPSYLNMEMSKHEVFKEKFGFTYRQYENLDVDFFTVSLDEKLINISEYDYILTGDQIYAGNEITDENRHIRVQLEYNEQSFPTIKITHLDEVTVVDDYVEFKSRLEMSYTSESRVHYDELSYVKENDSVSIRIIFSRVSFKKNNREVSVEYGDIAFILINPR